MKTISRRCALAAFAAAALAASAPALASGFPEKPVRFVVPNTAGSATDQLARTVGHAVQQRTGQAVVIENKAGANGIIAAEFVAKAPADGRRHQLRQHARRL